MSTAAMPTIDWVNSTDAQLTEAVDAYFASQGVPSESPYWTEHRGDLVTRANELGQPNYPDVRLQQADVFKTHSASGAMPPPFPGYQTTSTPVPVPPTPPAPVPPDVVGLISAFMSDTTARLSRIEAKQDRPLDGPYGLVFTPRK